jgi:hypothetical protein
MHRSTVPHAIWRIFSHTPNLCGRNGYPMGVLRSGTSGTLMAVLAGSVVTASRYATNSGPHNFLGEGSSRTSNTESGPVLAGDH